MNLPAVDRAEIHRELDVARASFHRLLATARPEQLQAQTQGTRWTNEELLFHMLLGYLVARALLPLVRAFGPLPPRASRRFATVLNTATGPFDVINYYGARAGAKVINRRRMGWVFDRAIASLHNRLDAESAATLRRRMSFPTRWDPFFRPVMTLADVYHYPADHFEFHRRQLTLDLNAP
jgi:hypothetical protein